MTDKECIKKGIEVIQKEAEAVAELANNIDDSFVAAVNTIYNAKGRVIISGMGKSGIIGKKIAATLTSTGTSAFFLHPAEGIHGDLGILHKDDVVISISQSGETADTLAALREAKYRGALTLGVVNSVGSSIARETDAGVYIHAGPEIGVASTKAFTSQVTVLILIMLLIARKKNMSIVSAQQILEELDNISEKVQSILAQSHIIEELAKKYKDNRNFLYLGRGINFPVALEGALKLKEISYIHAEGYPAAEMKHGPIALIDEKMPVIFIASKDSTYDKLISNIEEVRARKGIIIVIANHGDKEIARLADHVIYIPETCQALVPILSVIPLQLLSYYIAIKRGCDVDQPRNLAKSVTVE